MTTQQREALNGAIRQAVSNLMPNGYELNFMVIEEDALLTPERKKAKDLRLLVAKFFETPVEEIIAKCRKREVVLKRKMLCKILKNYTTLTLQQIAGLAGYGEDHTDVINAINSLNDLMWSDKEVKALYGELELNVYATFTKFSA